jgi:hypothetical protein
MSAVELAQPSAAAQAATFGHEAVTGILVGATEDRVVVGPKVRYQHDVANPFRGRNDFASPD